MWTIHRLELDETNVQLYCRASGNPAPLITWYDRDDRLITADDPHYKVSKIDYNVDEFKRENSRTDCDELVGLYFTTVIRLTITVIGL